MPTIPDPTCIVVSAGNKRLGGHGYSSVVEYSPSTYQALGSTSVSTPFPPKKDLFSDHLSSSRGPSPSQLQLCVFSLIPHRHFQLHRSDKPSSLAGSLLLQMLPASPESTLCLCSHSLSLLSHFIAHSLASPDHCQSPAQMPPALQSEALVSLLSFVPEPSPVRLWWGPCCSIL